MNSLTVIESWIASKMLANATIFGLVGQNIFLGEAEEGPELFVVFRYVDSRPMYTLGVKRAVSDNYYDIVVWQKGTNTLDAKTIANEIDDIFSDIKVEAYQGFEMSSQTERQLSLVDQTENGVIYRSLGGTYRIVAVEL